MAKPAPAPLSASLLGVPKGAAVPASEPVNEQVASPRRSAPEVVLPQAEEAKTALTVRLPVSTQERLREAAHRIRREKQSIVDEALSAWLDARGY